MIFLEVEKISGSLPEKTLIYKLNKMNIKNIHLVAIAVSTLFLTSCGKSIESDAKKIAELSCEAFKNTDKSLDIAIEIETIEEKYKGEDKEKLEKLAEEYYLKNCGKNN